MNKGNTDIRQKLSESLAQAAKNAGIAEPKVHLEHPDDISHGDFATNLALAYSKELKVNPMILAQKIIDQFEKIESKEAEVKLTLASPGFINIKLSQKYFTEQVREILKEGSDYGRQKIGQKNGERATVLVEYSSPNIAKPFTVGHLRSTIIGDALANILDFLGYKIIRDNHLGDWGTQFGKLIVAIKKWGNFDEIKKAEDPMRMLVDLYVKFHKEAEANPELEKEGQEWFAKLEQGNAEAREIWKMCIDRSLFAFDKIYKELGVKFDTLNGESMFGDYIPKVIEKLKKADLLKTSEGAQVVFFEGEKYPPLIIQKSDGASIYAARDLATDWYRKETYGDNLTIINEVGSEQTLYFRQIFEIEKMLGWFAEGERVHVAHGLYRFKDGKMSTREGNVIWLEDIISEAVSRAEKINPESGRDVAMAALKFNDLKRDSNQDIIFNWDEIMSMTGDSGPYLQYSCVRADAIVKKAEGLSIKPDLDDSKRPNDIPSLDTLESYLSRFPSIVAFAGASYKANIIATYLMQLASYFNNFYANTAIVKEGDESSAYKIAVTKAFATIMRNGLGLLGIKVPERM